MCAAIDTTLGEAFNQHRGQLGQAEAASLLQLHRYSCDPRSNS